MYCDKIKMGSLILRAATKMALEGIIKNLIEEFKKKLKIIELTQRKAFHEKVLLSLFTFHVILMQLCLNLPSC